MARPDSERRRERRVLAGGVLITAVALLLTYGVLPFARRWQLREAQIDAARERIAYLEGLTARTASLEAAATHDERVLSAQARRVLHARSATLAASATQAFLQDLADASQVVVSRLEVSSDDSVTVGEASVGAPETAGPLLQYVPVSLSAYGDIGGVTRVLHTLAGGPRVMMVESLALQRNAALAGAPDVVQFTVKLRAPVLPQ